MTTKAQVITLQTVIGQTESVERRAAHATPRNGTSFVLVACVLHALHCIVLTQNEMQSNKTYLINNLHNVGY